MVLTRRIAASLPALSLAGALLAGPRAHAAEGPTSPTDVQTWNEKVEGIMAKEGISLNGMFRSQYLHSSIGGPGASATQRSEESLEYTSVDFDVRARPNTLTQGRLIFRMHQDWRNFFSDVGNPISTRWLSIDGQAGGIFRYNVGDFREQYSPLTLYSPDIALLYEPEIFAAQRRDAMGEAFLGGNDRMLMGVNMNLDASLENSQTTVFDELHLNVLGARLRNVETSIGDGSKVTALVEKSYFEKFLAGSNADVAMPFGVTAGGSYLVIFDKKGSFNPGLPVPGSPLPADPETAAQFTNIFAGRGGLDFASMLGWGQGILSLGTEYAMTRDDSTYRQTVTRPDLTLDTVLTSTSIDGSALLARFQGGWKDSKAFNFKIGVDYHRNEPDFRNELAQTPSFRGERIMNLENSIVPLGTYDSRNVQYTTFDAMYRHAFKFAPSTNTNAWQKAPFSKNSYSKSIMTQGEMAAFAATRVDTALQLVMPFGPATANRDGFGVDFSMGAWEDRVQAAAMYAALNEIEGFRIDTVRTLPTTAFTQLGGGLKLEVGSMIGLAYPLTLSGSLVRSTAKNDGLANDTVYTLHNVQSDFLSAGLRYKFWKRAAVLGGFQQITTVNTRAKEIEETQRNLGGALEYKIAEGSYVTLGMDKVSFEPSAGSTLKKFSQLQSDLFLSVRF